MTTHKDIALDDLGGSLSISDPFAPSYPTQLPTDRPVRSLVVMHSADVTGPSRSLERELEWLAGLGEMEVLMPGPGRLESDFGRFATVRPLHFSALTVPRGPLEAVSAICDYGRALGRFRAAIRLARPDLVIATTPLLSSALLAARIEGVPSVLYAGEILDQPRVASLPRALAGAALLGLAGRWTTAVIACSDRVARQYSSRGAINVTTINPPIGPRYALGDPDRFCSQHGIPEEAPLIVSVGAITHGRAQDVLIRALPRIRSVLPDARLAIVGEAHRRRVDRDYAEEIEVIASEVAPGAVTFAGFEGRVEDAYAAASVVANPSRYEGFGRVAFEAALASRPVVSTSAGAIPDVLRNGTDALLVAPDRPRELADALVRVLGDRVLGDRLAETVKTRVRAELAPDGCLAAFQTAISEALVCTAA